MTPSGLTQLRPGQPSSLTFVGINRLAELLLRANLYIRRALVATYPFVFVDEFQDTTYTQYDFRSQPSSADRPSSLALATTNSGSWRLPVLEETRFNGCRPISARPVFLCSSTSVRHPISSPSSMSSRARAIRMRSRRSLGGAPSRRRRGPGLAQPDQGGGSCLPSAMARQ
jgi:hypothetical protein